MSIRLICKSDGSGFGTRALAEIGGKFLKWLLVIAVYAAPPDAVDWDGPWELGMTKLMDQQFDSETACRNFAIQLIGKMHQGMLAPMRFRCIPFDAELPRGATR